MALEADLRLAGLRQVSKAMTQLVDIAGMAHRISRWSTVCWCLGIDVANKAEHSKRQDYEKDVCSAHRGMRAETTKHKSIRSPINAGANTFSQRAENLILTSLSHAS